MEKIKDLLWTDPEELLDDDKALLDEDFEQLGLATATNREYWVASMEAAISSAEIKDGGIVPLQTTNSWRTRS